MNIKEFSKPLTAAELNESLAKTFGKKIELESYSLEALQDARNKLRTKVREFETNESFNSVHTESFQSARLFLDVLNAEISERENFEAAMPDENNDGVPDYAQDGKGKNDLGKGKTPEKSKKKKDLSKVPPQLRKHMKKKTDEGKEIINNYFKYLAEGAEDQAEIVMAAKDMVDRVTSWMEDTAEMQTESMLELADAIRDEMGSEQSETFVSTVKPALEALYTTMESSRIQLTTGVGLLTGEEQAPMMGDDEAPVEEPEMEPTVDQEEAPVDDFEASEPAAGGEEEAGRAKRESFNRKARVLETSRRLGTILSSKKK